jgi:hypothetical protein
MTRPDKATRKALVRRWQESRREQARALFPLDDARLESFFDVLECLFMAQGCFHDIRHSLSVISAIGLTNAEADSLLDWCNDHGGFCDCEILANTQDFWHSNRVGGSLNGA